MSLAESSGPQTRKSTKGSKSSYSLSVAAGQSPGPSPGQGRREERGVERGGGKSHERSLSDTPPVPVGKWEGGRERFSTDCVSPARSDSREQQRSGERGEQLQEGQRL